MISLLGIFLIYYQEYLNYKKNLDHFWNTERFVLFVCYLISLKENI